MMPYVTTTQQIERAWKLLEDGSALGELRASCDRLTAIRRELDDVIVAFAQRIEQLRPLVAVPHHEEETQNDEEEDTENDKEAI